MALKQKEIVDLWRRRAGWYDFTARLLFTARAKVQHYREKVLEARSMDRTNAIGGIRCPRLQLISFAFVLSMTMLAYDILLTRIASVLLINQFVFLVVGLSLLGVSAGAVAEYGLTVRRTHPTEPALGVWLSLAAGILVLAVFLIMKVGPEAGFLVLAVSAALPFAVSGFLFSRLFRLFSKMTGTLYAADLAGAAIGALTVPLLLPALGPNQSIFTLATTLAAFGVLLSLANYRVGRTTFTTITLIVVAGLTYGNLNDFVLGRVPIGNDPDKDLYRITKVLGMPTETIDSRWSMFGRTDLVRFPDNPSMMAVFIDGAAGADMIRFDGRMEDAASTVLKASPDFGAMIPLLSLKESPRDSALIIGPGGGKDVLIALAAGFKSITAVEINPQMVQVVKDYQGFNGGIYTRFNNVHVIVGEGRHFLRHTQEKYDLIMAFMPITKSSRSLNAFALSEGYLFTKEAFADYHRHLTKDGTLLLMAHGMPEAVKFMTTALQMLQGSGMSVQKAMPHLYILGSDMMPLFGMRKTPLPQQESNVLHAIAHSQMYNSQYSYIPGIEQAELRPSLSTGIASETPMMNPLFISLAEGKVPLDRLERGAGINLVPATDDRPFFYQFSFGFPAVISMVWWLAMAVLSAVFLIPRRHFQKFLPAKAEQLTWWLPIFFTAIGIGYIVIELALFQKVVFYLGDPSRTLALLLAALLAGSGVGSFISRSSTGKSAELGGLVSAATILVVLVGVAPLFSALHNSGYAVQRSAAAVILFFQGIPLGLMFPIGLRVVEDRLSTSAIPWMWAVNGASSVVGSALAIMIAMSMGYSWSLLFGAFCYLAAALAMRSVLGRSATAPR